LNKSNTEGEWGPKVTGRGKPVNRKGERETCSQVAFTLDLEMAERSGRKRLKRKDKREKTKRFLG